MKNIALLMFLISFVGLSQKVESLEITPYGINGFLVKNYDDKSAQELYSLVKKWTQYNIYDADFSINSDVENEYISFKIRNIGVINWKGSRKWAWNVNLQTEVRFKEGKVRIDLKITSFDGIGVVDDLQLIGNSITMSIYNKSHQLKSKSVYLKENLDKILNEFTQYIFDSIEGKVDYKKDDW